MIFLANKCFLYAFTREKQYAVVNKRLFFAFGRSEFPLHENVGNTCLDERFANLGKSEVPIERHGIQLRMNAEDVSALSFGFGNEAGEKYSSVAFAMFEREHSSGTEYARRGHEVELCVVSRSIVAGLLKEPRVGDDLACTSQREVRGGIIDVIFVQIHNTLLEDKNGETRLEDLVDLSGGEFGKRFDIQFQATRERCFSVGFGSSNGIPVKQAAFDLLVRKLANGQELVKRMPAVVFLHLCFEHLDLFGIGHQRIEYGTYPGVQAACCFLGFGSRSAVILHLIGSFRAITYAVNFFALFREFSANQRAIGSVYFCHRKTIKSIYTMYI